MTTVQLKLPSTTPSVASVTPTVAINATGQGTGQGPRASDYSHFDDQKQHILACPNMYVGSIKQMATDARVLVGTPEGNRIVNTQITVPDAVERLYLEILSNGADNVGRSRQAGVDIGSIDILMDRSTISITNGGLPIPIEVHPQYGVYVPEMIFGMLLSGSNYDKSKDRTGAGVNGLGAKLTNVFSRAFSVTVGNPDAGAKYTQVWNDSMTIRSDPTIEAYSGHPFVTITYTINFPYFGYAEPSGSTGAEGEVETGGYPDEAFCLFALHAAEASFNAKVPVTFNGMSFNYSDIKDYAGLYFGPTTNVLIHREYPEMPKVDENGKKKKRDASVMPTVELCVADTPDEAICVSFVNTMVTKDGGVHVEEAYKVLAKEILEPINKSLNSKSKSADKKNKISLTLTDVKPHLSIIMSCHLQNPEFTSQSKTSLKSPKPKIAFPSKMVNAMMKWEVVNRLYAAVEAKQFKKLQKTDGKKRRHVAIDKAEDANEAGGKNSRACSLFVTEGLSAMEYANRVIELIPNGRDTIGVMPLRGKPLNVMNSSIQQIMDNKVFNNLKEMLGLREGANYIEEAEFEGLRYGHLIILVDSDEDSKHIQSLVLNYFHCRFPSLLARGYLMYLRTPILKVTHGEELYKFYTEHEYETWKTQIEAERGVSVGSKDGKGKSTWRHKYLKGLGSSSKEDIAYDSKAPRYVYCVYDDSSSDMFRLAFDEKLADERKVWIANHKYVLGVDEMIMQPISNFIFYKLVEYSIANLSRSIPAFIDGLKQSQRKIIWGALCKWGSLKGMRKWKKKILTGDVEEFKVGRFASAVAEQTNYKHGEKSLCDTIVCMAQSFIGTNNLPYMTEDGGFGTRNLLGKDAADARYSFTRPMFWIPFVYRNEDMQLLRQVVDEGDEVEPENFLPIVPMLLINGANGIGTGHSTFIPNYNPVDICNWIKARIRGEPLPTILPWYRDFTGDIRVIIRAMVAQNSDDQAIANVDLPQAETELIEGASVSPVTTEIPVPVLPAITDATIVSDQGQVEESGGDPMGDDDVDVEPSKMSMVTSGKFTVDKDRVIVTELPIWRSMNGYKEWLDILLEKKLITDYINRSTCDRPYFEILGFNNPTLKTLRLQRSFGLSNMVMLDDNNRPMKYNTVEEIMEAFYQKRYPFYEARRSIMVSNIQVRIDRMTEKARFIRAVVDKQIIVLGRKKSQIAPEMEQMGMSPELLKTTNLYHCTEEEIVDILAEIEQLNSERTEIEAVSAGAMWIRDIDEFVQVYTQYYSESRTTNVTVDGAGAKIKTRKKKVGSAPTKGAKGGAKGKAKGGAKATRTRTKKA